jgi:two-component system, NarL family, invasion response regulator UvrY
VAKVLIADDHAVVRKGVKQILAEEPDFESIGEAKNAAEALKCLREENWDVLILDITMPGNNALNVLRELKHLRPNLPVLILSMHPEDQFAVRVLKLGAAGYVTKDSVPKELVKAIRKVLAGGKYVSPSLAEKLAIDLELEADTEKPLHDKLSRREYQVLCLIASGKTVKEIAGKMYLSVKTISTYRARILQKTNLQSNAEIMRYCIINGLVD